MWDVAGIRSALPHSRMASEAGEIQADSQYSRLHNYASAELLYKNMVVVSVLAMGIGVGQQNMTEIIIGAVSVVLFARRWIRFAERSRGYTICWFVQKYDR